jgi:two-component system LytT family response regulator
MEPLRIVLVDDEVRIRTSLKHLISMYYEPAQLVGEAEDILTAGDLIKGQKPDVVLLDINMPGGSGFELLKQFNPMPFKVVFITAFDDYAVQAFKFSALDYLLKPVNPDELVAALQKAHKQLHAEETSLRMETFLQNISGTTRDSKKIVLNTQEAMHIINITDIVRCEADRNYTKFIIKGSKNILVSGSLKEYDEMLSAYGFFRSHHSHLVNLDYIDRFDKRDGGRLILKDGSEILLAVRKKDELMAALARI